MPKNKFQDAVFTAIMAAVMVYGMIVYNVHGTQTVFPL